MILKLFKNTFHIKDICFSNIKLDINHILERIEKKSETINC